jgi:DNA polymerase III delta subunit
VGEEQDLLDQEIAKLSLYASTRTGRITRADVEEIVLPTDEGIIWKMTDMISAGRKNDAFSYATRMIDRGGDPYGMWAVLLSMLKNVINVRGAAQDGGSDPKDIGQEIGLHFFAVRSLLPYARRVKEGALSRHLETTVSSDIALKTGGYKATDEAPEELLALIDRFILTCP